MRFRSLVLTTCLLLALRATAESPRLPQWAGEVDRVFSTYGAETPGCAVGVDRAGEIVYAKGYGLADIERRVPITTSTVFDLGTRIQ